MLRVQKFLCFGWDEDKLLAAPSDLQGLFGILLLGVLPQIREFHPMHAQDSIQLKT
jgi:hypothetical protein